MEMAWLEDNSCNRNSKYIPFYSLAFFLCFLPYRAHFFVYIDLWFMHTTDDFVLADFEGRGFGLPGKISNIKVILNGGQRVTFLRPDGFFSLYPTIIMHTSF